MKTYRRICFFIMMLFGCLSSISFADIYNPEPADGDFILPMPNGAQMVFRRVFIGEGAKPFALREFKVGDSTGGFKEFPTDVVIGGSFIEENPHSKLDWMYYIGKYEVSEAQYHAAMKPGTASDSQEPIKNISWFEAQEFINTYNIWLFEHAQNQLPKNEEAFGFVRLPTEIEWEFAARGGNQVSLAEFDKKYPYPEKLSKYEWFSGPSSSHDKLKKIGLRKSNPLGLHDMLGNVSEMTSNFYQIEYYQGRVGGFVARGGHYLTAEKSIRSSLRHEIPFYKNFGPTKQPTLGLRLAIASPVYASRETSKQLADAWDKYVGTTRQPPASPGVTRSSISVRTDLTLAEARNFLTVIERTLQDRAPDVHRSLETHFGSLEASFTNLESTVKKAEHDSAYAWVKIAAETAFLINRDLKRLLELQKVLKLAKKAGKSALVEKVNERVMEAEQNINDGFNTYASVFEQLENSEKDTVLAAFEKYQEYLQLQGAPRLQIQLNKLVKRHFLEYHGSRRADTDKWRADLEKF